MIELVIFYLIIILVSFYFLVKSADYLLSSSSVLGEKIGISKFAIGLTLVAIGTSLPELFTSLFGIIDSKKNAASFVFGTVIGSNIANILLVFAILLLFSKNFKVNLKKTDSIFFLLSTLLLGILVFSGILNYYYSIIFLFLFGLYLFICVKSGSEKEFEIEIKELKDKSITEKNIWFLLFIFLVSLLVLNLSAKGVVFGITKFGYLVKIPISFLTFTTVAFATSLPEMMVSYSSAKRSEYDLAVGNIVGSNISNILFILGIGGLVKTVKFNPNFYINNFIVLFFLSLFFIVILSIKKMTKKESQFFGYTLIVIYIIYLIYILYLL